jgi:hypothetical protein
MGEEKGVTLSITNTCKLMVSVLFDVFNISCCNLAMIECYILTLWTHSVIGSVSPHPGLSVLPATVFMEHSCRETSSHSASQIFGPSANPNVHYYLCECWPVVLPEPNDSYALLPYFSKCMPSA